MANQACEEYEDLSEGGNKKSLIARKIIMTNINDQTNSMPG